MIFLETDIYQVLNSSTFPTKGHLNLNLLLLIIEKNSRILTPFYNS